MKHIVLVERWMRLPYSAPLGITGCNIIVVILLSLIRVLHPSLVYIITTLLIGESVLISYTYPKLVAQLQQAKAELCRLQAIHTQQQESEHFKKHLLPILNHEMRAPLSTVKGYAVLLETYRGELDEETQTHYIEQIDRACDETIAILDSIITGTQQGEQAIILHRVNLAEQLQAVLDSLMPLIQKEQRQVELHTEPVFVLAHPLHLRQVIRNLLVNAMNYSPAGTPLQITITLQHPGMPQRQADAGAASVFISISDQGIGISPEDRERLFQPFTRLEAGKATAPRGCGLGLFLCKGMLKSMNGEIWLESEDCEGYRTTFWFSLQIA